MKILIPEDRETMLNQVVNRPLLDGDRIYLLRHFKIVEERGKRYVTECVMHGYHTEGRFVGVFNEDATEKYVLQTNLYQLRNNWEVFKQQLKAYGYKVIPIATPQNQMQTNE